MSEEKTDEQKEKPERKFNQEQYDMLLRCSEKKDMTEWNEWREANRQEPVLLGGADLSKKCLRRAYLSRANLEDANLEEARMDGADLLGANLRGAYLGGASITAGRFQEADLQRAILVGARMQGADFVLASLKAANLSDANLDKAVLWEADLEDAYLHNATLRRARIEKAKLGGARLWRTNLEGARCEMAVVNGSTILSECKVDRRTDTRGVGLASARVEQGLRQLLEYNGRRLNWADWYKHHRFLKGLIRPFWWVSDYGRSTWRIIKAFFLLAILFAIIYYAWGLADRPGIVRNLFEDQAGLEVPCSLVPVRAVYFSIVTMTTLGFGDMYAYAGSFWGHVLLTVQVLLGYLLLAALVTRFAILFQAGGPAGEFAKKQKKGGNHA